jgi:hypothetical protein
MPPRPLIVVPQSFARKLRLMADIAKPHRKPMVTMTNDISSD